MLLTETPRQRGVYGLPSTPNLDLYDRNPVRARKPRGCSPVRPLARRGRGPVQSRLTGARLEAVVSAEAQESRCPTCWGRGWLYVRLRPVYRPDVPGLPVSRWPSETCWDCSGAGRTAAAA